MDEKWEYTTLTIASSSLPEGNDRLKLFGERGWEAYAVITSKGFANVYETYYFKRRKGGSK